MDIDKKSERSHELGLKYLEARHQEIIVVKEEESRKQKVQAVLLHEKNDQLEDQLSQLNYRMKTISFDYEDARIKLDSMELKCQEQEKQLRAQVREHSTLRTELMSLSSVTQDSTKVLTEKLALSREISVLKPEVEHLRSQLAHQKDVLAEKLALERQLNTLELELANEKRAAQRAAQRQESQESEMEKELRQQVQDLEKKVASERRAKDAQMESKTEMQQRIQELEAQLGQETQTAEQRMSKEGSKATEKLKNAINDLERALEGEKRESQRIRKEAETELSEARSQTEALEQRVADLKAKLREVRDELKAARVELATTKESVNHIPDIPKKTAKTTTKLQTQAQRKRRGAEQTGPELLLQTPGIGDEGRMKRPLKKRGFDRIVAVEKSNFSITPFLNKTASMAEDDVEAEPAGPSETEGLVPGPESDEAAASAPEDEGESELQDSILGTTVTSSIALPSVDVPAIAAVKSKKADGGEAPKRRGRPPKEKVLGEMLALKKIVQVSASSGKESTVAREGPAAEASNEQENRPPIKAAVAKKVLGAVGSVTTKVVAEPEPKKKKRKILGASNSTIFNDDDDAGVKGSVVEEAVAGASGPTVKRTAKALGGTRPMATGAGKRTMLGGVRNAFGAVGGGFSPLKRDRRGVNASFLA
ncbi:viral a-type inclusion protein [Grosmannia clavigera kw1407]|uniref:Viral a-type inclusion protein n=1 Tax=Grosmannia clavigera (strain kw1407 / UAMH 11150) TaxID=655863 RepID=F0XSI1_GROCL|nr:viral a-type inclusion protein [Grosmannia clavigera kw1407]EFW99304.1 viral a-type inclusion protein [Grosmannia clavigera kw1407]